MKYVIIHLKVAEEIIAVPDENVRHGMYRREGKFWVKSRHIYDTFAEAKEVALRIYEARLSYFLQRMESTRKHLERVSALTEEKCRKVDSVTSHVIRGEK